MLASVCGKPRRYIEFSAHIERSYWGICNRNCGAISSIHKKITKPMLGFKSFLTAEKTLKGIEAMHMIRKGQAENNSSVFSTVEWLNEIFGIVA
ncbi:transposase-like protein [Paenibacillus aceris]|uniref:Transposase-like protein n=1 Tax=Paenibacillus aceris TaxID=869555 RepID=A0ABS4I1Z5_9BACL|nr:transposase-like protein [Paenibacillus aceris]